MLKNLIKIEAEVAGKIYHFLCDHDSPIGDVKEAIFQITKVIGNVEANIAAAQKQAESAKVEEQPAQEEVAK